MRKSLKCLIVPFALVLGSASFNPLAAQGFTDPIAAQYIFNTVQMKEPVQTANYSTGYLNIAAWNTHTAGESSEMIYSFINPLNPPYPISTGSFIYKDVMDIEVGHYYDLNLSSYAVAVAYYQIGNGHFMDIYKVDNMANTLTFAYQLQLSNSPQYGRIRMDSHFEYGIALVWEEAGAGLATMAGEYGNWSSVIHLGGTNGATAPDLAFSHSDYGTLNLHYVYKDLAQQTISVSKLDYNIILTSGGVLPPTPVDMVPLPNNISNIVIDCPDHYHAENWAYTYTDGNRVFLRRMDEKSMGLPQTTVVNDGSLGNVPTANGNNKAYSPTLHYGDGAYNVGGFTGQIHVGWYNIDNNNNGIFQGRGQYIGVEVREAGWSMISDPDYMGISQNPQEVLPTTYPGIAFSKMGEGHWGSAPQYLYSTYFTETAPGSGDYQLHHAFHKWTDTRFKGGNKRPHPDCGKHRPVAQAQAPVTELNVYPNPFKNTLTNNVTMTAAGLLELSLTDISGRQVGKKQVSLNKGRYMVEMDNLGHLIPGTYFLSSFVDGKITGTKTVVKQ